MTRISTRLAVTAIGALIVTTAWFIAAVARAGTRRGLGTIALTGARVIDGTGARRWQATIVITQWPHRGGWRADGRDNPGRRGPHRLSGKTIMPGIINAHAHVNADSELKTPVRDQLAERLNLRGLRHHDGRQPGITPRRRAGRSQAARRTGACRTRSGAGVCPAGVRAVAKTPEEARKIVDLRAPTRRSTS